MGYDVIVLNFNLYLCSKYRQTVVNDACGKASISECRVPV